MIRTKTKVMTTVGMLLLVAGMAGPLLAAQSGDAGLPVSLGLKPGFTPVKERLATRRWIAFDGSGGCEIGRIDGLEPIYVITFKQGLLPGDPLAPGDVIVAVNREPLTSDPIRALRAKIASTRDKLELISITRWRNGSIETITINPTPQPPDLTQGGKRDESCSDMTLGPIGARGWIFWGQDMTALSRQILITAVAKGSPADGILRTNDVILGVNGKPFADDARRSLGHAITAAEDKKGVLRLMRWRAGKTENVELKLAVLGKYSDTAPYNCPKSKAIFEQGCRLIAKQGMKEADIPIDLNALALLASGKEEYRPMLALYARKVTASLKRTPGASCWSYAYGNLFLAEYVLATGDRSILPELKRTSVEAAGMQCMNGMWGHHPPLSDGHSEGYGGMNQVGLPMTMALVLARKAGVSDPAVDKAIDESVHFLGWFTGKGSIPYGDHAAGASHENNGMCSSSAVFWDILGDRDAATFFSKMATAAYDERDGGHTGNFFNLLWALPGGSRCGSMATGAYLKETAWYYDLARAWDGSFAFQRGEDDAHKFNGWDSTGAYLLSFGLPLKSLYITGKNPSGVKSLNEREVKDVIAAGRDVHPRNFRNGYNQRPIPVLLAGLSSWSPEVRDRSALALSKHEGDFLPVLLKRLAGSDRYGRYGACMALGHLGERADAAAPQLRAAIKDPDLWMEWLACDAISKLSPAARNTCVNDLLELAAGNNPADPRRMVQRAVAIALFSPNPITHEPAALGKSLDGVDRRLLYPALNSLLRNDDSLPRGAIAPCFTNMSAHDLAVMLPEIVKATATMAPSNEMFAEGIRLAGLDLLSTLHIREGMELCVSTLEWRWGNQWQKRLEYLARYGSCAKEVVPELRKKIPQNYPDGAKAIENCIAGIEASTNMPTLVSMKDFIENIQRAGK